jgi:hypothetical protein
VTEGLRAFGQREIAFTLRRSASASPEKVSRDPLPFLSAIAPLAERGQIVDAGGFTQVGRHGLLAGFPALRGVAYETAYPMAGISLPEGCLAAIALVEHEMDTVKHFGALRVLSRIGREYRYFPTAPWCDPNRPALMLPEAETLLGKVACSRFAGTFVVLEGERLVLRMSRAAVPLCARALADFPANEVLALLPSLDPNADSCLVWSPGQRAPFAISPTGSGGRRMAGCFVLFVPEQEADGGQIIEDGFAMMLTDASWTKLRSAMTTGADLVLPSTEPDKKGLVLEWYSASDVGPNASEPACVTLGTSEAGAPALRTQHVVLYQPDGALGARLPGGVQGLAGFLRTIQQRLAKWYAAHDVGRTARALVIAVTPTNYGFWLLAPTGSASELTDIRALLDDVPRPTVLGGPVAFAVVFNLGEDFPSRGGVPPTPAEWAEVAREAGESLSVDDILTRLLG